MHILASFLKKKGTPAASAIEISADVFLNQVAVSIVILELIQNRYNNITLANGTTIPELQHSSDGRWAGPPKNVMVVLFALWLPVIFAPSGRNREGNPSRTAWPRHS